MIRLGANKRDRSPPLLLPLPSSRASGRTMRRLAPRVRQGLLALPGLATLFLLARWWLSSTAHPHAPSSTEHPHAPSSTEHPHAPSSTEHPHAPSSGGKPSRIPPWTALRKYERELPQQNLDLPYPEGRTGRYVHFGNQIRGLGWNNVLNEMCVCSWQDSAVS
jgi:hypothetical protein